MKALVIPLALVAAPVEAEGVVAPSGMAVTLHEVLYEVQPYSEELWAVIRLLAPDLADAEADPQEDLDWACTHFAPGAVDAAPEPPVQIVVQIMDRVVPRGQADAEAAQVFAGYVFDDDSCIWEGF